MWFCSDKSLDLSFLYPKSNACPEVCPQLRESLVVLEMIKSLRYHEASARCISESCSPDGYKKAGKWQIMDQALDMLDISSKISHLLPSPLPFLSFLPFCFSLHPNVFNPNSFFAVANRLLTENCTLAILWRLLFLF